MKYLIALYLLPVSAFAEEVVEKLPWYEELPSKLGDFAGSLAEILGGAEVLGVAAVLEIVFRLIKSKKPLSILIGIQKIFKGLETIIGVINSGLDKIVPQRTE